MTRVLAAWERHWARITKRRNAKNHRPTPRRKVMTDHIPAQNRTESDAQPEKGSTDADAATVARRDRYAEAIQRAIEDQPAHMTETGPLIVSGLPRAYAGPMSDRAAAAVLAVADEELAGLRAEVERVDSERSTALTNTARDLNRALDRAEAAETELRALREGIEGLAEQWEPYGRRPPEYMWASLRALLAPKPAAPAGEWEDAANGNAETDCTRCGWSEAHHRADGTVRTKFAAFLDNCGGYTAPVPVSSGEAGAGEAHHA